jgi:NitT/TauT family transport system substrate-binding protein
MRKRISALVHLIVMGWLLGAGIASAAPHKVRLAVGGQGLFYYLPLTLTQSLGYFRDAGLDVQIADFPGGAKALQALMGGSAEVVAGSFEHVVTMRARGQALTAFSLIARYPAIVLAVHKDFTTYRGPADLAGHVVGLTAPGSSTHLFLNNLLHGAGVAATAVPVLGVGAGASAVAALRHGDIDALVHLDPVIEELVSAGDVRVVVDTRTPEGAAVVYGGTYLAACLYSTEAYIKANPAIIEALATAQARALRWAAAASDEEIMNAVPAAQWQRDREAWRRALARNRAIWSPDGRLDPEGARHVLVTLSRFERQVAEARIDPTELLLEPTQQAGK